MSIEHTTSWSLIQARLYDYSKIAKLQYSQTKPNKYWYDRRNVFVNIQNIPHKNTVILIRVRPNSDDTQYIRSLQCYTSLASAIFYANHAICLLNASIWALNACYRVLRVIRVIKGLHIFPVLGSMNVIHCVVILWIVCYKQSETFWE